MLTWLRTTNKVVDKLTEEERKGVRTEEKSEKIFQVLNTVPATVAAAATTE